MKIISLITALLVTATSLTIEAKVVQILHTNDTHSFLDHSTHNVNTGGMARLKALIDQYKSEALTEDVKTIVLDAGDFLEGNLFYMAEEGRKSFQIYNEMGYDVGALGNHDYLMGSEKLDSLLSEFKLNFSFVAANLQIDKKFKNIKKKIRPYAELNIDGLKIGILGLTTNEILYKWSLNDCEITDPIAAAQFYEDELKNRGNDAIIALTHIGIESDLKLVKATSKIDLVVGGHSHTNLFRPLFEKNRNGKKTPIFHAGMHTEYLGRILIDIEKGKPLKILKAELIPVNNINRDGHIHKMVKEAKNSLDEIFGKDHLSEVLGLSNLSLEDTNAMTRWGSYIANTMKEETSSDISIHAPSMNSENFPVGSFTRFDLYNSIPRIFNLKNKGWNIYTAKVQGVWIKSLVRFQSKLGHELVYGGLEVEADGKIRINGQDIRPERTYKVAFTEGMIKGAGAISSKVFAFLKKPTQTNSKIWNALERKIIRDQMIENQSVP